MARPLLTVIVIESTPIQIVNKMERKIIIGTIALLSSAALAQNSADNQSELVARVQTEKTATPELILAKNEANKLALWENLDINKDDSISKIEAAASKEVFVMWDKLDTNHNDRLDTDEFAQILQVKEE